MATFTTSKAVFQAISNNILTFGSFSKLENYLKSVNANESFEIISLDSLKFIFKYNDDTYQILNEQNHADFVGFLIQDDFMNKNYYTVLS